MFDWLRKTIGGSQEPARKHRHEQRREPQHTRRNPPAKIPPPRPEEELPVTGSSPKPRGAGVRIDSGVVFDFPATWQYYKEGNQCIFKSPRREQVILSAFTITPPTPSAERDGYLHEIFQNGLRAAREALEYPDFRIIKPLAEDRSACALTCWTATAETKVRDVFFAEAVIRHKHGTILLTYEAPFHVGTEEAFRSLLKLIYES